MNRRQRVWDFDWTACETYSSVREAAVEWARSNGLDPTRIPSGGLLRIERTRDDVMLVHLHEYVLDERGAQVPDPAMPNSVKMEKRTVPMKAAPTRGLFVDYPAAA